MKRREFLKSSIALPAAATLPAAAPTASEEKARVRHYRRLGRTGIEISDISMGTGQLPAASLVLRAIDAGINYFDTAPDYGRAEEYLGEALRKHKGRDKLYVASKYCQPRAYEAGVSHLQVGSTKADYKKAVEGSLQRLNTEYLDVVFVHAIGERNDYTGERARLFDDNMLAATAELKAEGKVRYLAASSHGPYQMEQLLLEAVTSGHFDLIMPAFNFIKFPKVPDVIKEAQGRGVGVIAMKTLAGAKDLALDPKGAAFEHAAFKWVLQHPEVAGLVVTMKRVQDIELYLQASGGVLAASDQRLLDRYVATYGQDYCRTGCGECEACCPAGVPIASILRYQMYFEDYADQKRAMADYAALPRNAAACLTCTAQGCNGGCPHGLPVALKLRTAHEDLIFAGVV